MQTDLRMSRPQKTSPDKAFVDRLKEIAESLGSYAALAKRAGLAASTFQNYLDGGEPQRPALIALAAAGNVSLTWLATGLGPKDSTLVPPGLVELPKFDLRESIFPLMRGEWGSKRDSILLGRDTIERIGVALNSLTAVIISDAYPPTVNDDDVVVFANNSFVTDGRLYLLAHGVKAIVRPLHQKRGSMFLTDRDGKPRQVDPKSPEFRILGRVHWRGGIV
jgi:hypothetical protein